MTPEAAGKLDENWLKSLYRQAMWLEKNIEYHLLANHFFKNGKALTFAGLFFAGEDAERWLTKGLAILGEELDEQIQGDGGHFERSPMYHAMILEDCLDLLNVTGGCEQADVGGVRAKSQGFPPPRRGRVRVGVASVREKLADVSGKMSRYLAAMRHPDGGIALFNDAAFGIEAAPAALIAYHERLTGSALPEADDRCISFPEPSASPA